MSQMPLPQQQIPENEALIQEDPEVALEEEVQFQQQPNDTIVPEEEPPQTHDAPVLEQPPSTPPLPPPPSVAGAAAATEEATAVVATVPAAVSSGGRNSKLASSQANSATAGVGSGTTNQQRLKSHVQQFVIKMRNDSEFMYREVVKFCRNTRDPDSCFDFHRGLGDLFKPYGEQLIELNKLLHADYQFPIPSESSNIKLGKSEISNEAMQTPAKKGGSSSDANVAEKKSNSNTSSGQQLNMQEKVKMVCKIIQQDCPEKLQVFIQQLQTELDGKENQLPLFIQTSSVIFGEGTPIYQKILKIFADQISVSPSGVVTINNKETGKSSSSSSNNHANTQATHGSTASAASTTNTKQTKEGKTYRRGKNANAAAAAAAAAAQANATNQNQQSSNDKTVATAGDKKGALNSSSPVKSIASNHLNTSTASTFRGHSVRLNDTHLDNQSLSKVNMFNGGEPYDHHIQQQQKNYTIAGANKSEANFLYLIDNHMDAVAFTNMLKLLFLYIECIITASEMVDHGSQLLLGFANPEKFIEQLKDLVECREASRRKTNPHFKPLNDFDFNTHERFTHSYVEMPKFYPKYCSNSTELSRSVLNTSIVTVPQGTEHVTFSIMRKNHYEEQLFKSEDEKYEFDHHIQMYRLTIKTLQAVQSCADPVKARNLMQKAIDMKIIMYLYKNSTPESQEISELLLKNPHSTARVAIDRLRAKLHEIECVKLTQSKKTWHEVSEKNFHRSLDHRSFIFKRHDRKFTLASRFEKEPEFRNKMILCSSFTSSHPLHKHKGNRSQKQQDVHVETVSTTDATAAAAAAARQASNALSGAANHQHSSADDAIDNTQDYETEIAQYFTFLNTFQGTTNVEKCSHVSSEHLLQRFDYNACEKKIALPMMTFIFENPAICEDTFSLLMHYSQIYAPMNHAEREKIKRTAQTVLKGLFNFNYKNLEQSDITVNENKTIKIVTDIENKIFEKFFAYLRPTIATTGSANGTEPMDEEQQQQQQQTDEAAAVKSTLHPKGKLSKSHHHNQRGGDGTTHDEDHEPKVATTTSQRMLNKKAAAAKEKHEENNEHRSPDHSPNSLNDLLDDENSRNGAHTIREMSYAENMINENIYLPSSHNLADHCTFYGTKHLYIFLRFFYVLYERLYKAEETSRYFEDNEKTRQLTDAEKQELARDRYAAFKQILLGSLKLRETKYEDFLRSIFGKQAFLLFTIDKTLLSATKSLQALASDELSSKMLAIFVSSEFKMNSLPQNEEILYSKINKMILEATSKSTGVNASNGASDARSFFRFTREKSHNILYINYIDSTYKNWEVEQISRSKEYFNAYSTHSITPATSASTSVNRASLSDAPVFLSRNKRKNEAKLAEKKLKIYMENNIEYIALPNTTHLISAGSGKEDYMVTSAKLSRRKVSLESLIAVEIGKQMRFAAWCAQKQSHIISTTTTVTPTNKIDEIECEAPNPQ